MNDKMSTLLVFLAAIIVSISMPQEVSAFLIVDHNMATTYDHSSSLSGTAPSLVLKGQPTVTTIITDAVITRTKSRTKQQLWRRLVLSGTSDGQEGFDDDDDDGRDEQDDKDDSNNYMSVVRSLQNSFYKTASSTPSCFFDWEHNQQQKQQRQQEEVRQSISSIDGEDNESSGEAIIPVALGQVRNLPILTWPWHELPGRANVLHVHEGVYTHMMETVLRSNPAVWYIGHVYRHGKQTERELQCWHNISSKTNDDGDCQDRGNKRSDGKDNDDDYDDDEDNNNTVLGTLMRITDYRRISDGRLLVLVQGLERFVVEEIVQTAPYSVAHVQLLPDINIEEDDDDAVVRNRLDAVLESFQKWHRYEFEQTQLPLPSSSNQNSNRPSSEKVDEEKLEKKKFDEEEYLDPSQIIGLALTQVIPHAHYSSVVNVQQLQAEPTLRQMVNNNNIHSGNDSATINVEQQLMERGIFSLPWLDRDLRNQTCSQLERILWVWIDKYLKQTKRPVSPSLLALLPPGGEQEEEKWPRSFVLEFIFNAIVKEQEKDKSSLDPSQHRFVTRISEHYPALRRQQRLSYAAASLLEDFDSELGTHSLRMKLLRIPSTQQRLAFVLQNFRERAEGGGAFQ